MFLIVLKMYIQKSKQMMINSMKRLKSLTDYLNIHQVEVEKLKGLLPVSKRYGDLNSTPFLQQQSNFKNDVLSQ